MPRQPGLTSVILPTYNRAAFLPAALDAIAAQECSWELVVVDDGSTDGTPGIVEAFARRTGQRVRSIRQENRGAYAARNRGLDAAEGEFIAFYDSDDVWLPHHLAHGVAALRDHPDVDWVYGACRMIDHATGRELEASTFHRRSGPVPWLRLNAERRGMLRVIDDEGAIEGALLHGLDAGLQNSVIRAAVFDRLRFRTRYGARELSPSSSSRSPEDQLLVIRALAAGFRLAYFDAVHVVYHVHDENASAASVASSVEKQVDVFRTMIDGYEALGVELRLDARARRALRRRLSQEYFWHLGYATLLQSGRVAEALPAFRRAIRLYPWNHRYWKTYLATRLATLFRV